MENNAKKSTNSEVLDVLTIFIPMIVVAISLWMTVSFYEKGENESEASDADVAPVEEKANEYWYDNLVMTDEQMVQGEVQILEATIERQAKVDPDEYVMPVISYTFLGNDGWVYEDYQSKYLRKDYRNLKAGDTVKLKVIVGRNGTDRHQEMRRVLACAIP